MKIKTFQFYLVIYIDDIIWKYKKEVQTILGTSLFCMSENNGQKVKDSYFLYSRDILNGFGLHQRASR